MSCLITMSQKELNRLEAIQKIRDGRLRVVHAAKLLHLSRSQVHRLLQAYDQDGANGLVSKKRGRPSNRRFSDEFRNSVLDLVREHYHDFGPTFACEKLLEKHDLPLGKETLRRWMMEAGIWKTRRERQKQIHQPRGRRDCFGELVQVDGSHHHWFEDRGPKCALLVFIDDATSKILHLRFATSENTFDYMEATKAYLSEWGKPIAFYSDKHGVFRTTHASGKDRTSGLTQFGRALYELNIDIICADTPQAKGRVERANRTLQDRLVKELRLAGINTIDEANDFALGFIADYNSRFGKPPRNPKDMHRSLADHENLDGAMCRKEVRTVSQSLTLRYDKVLFILDPTSYAKKLVRQKVIICDYPDGRLEIMHEGMLLPYRTYDTLQSIHRAPVVENKRLDDILSIVAGMQESRAPTQRSAKGPSRVGQKNHTFGIPDGSSGNGYKKRGRKPGRRTDASYMSAPETIAHREQAIARRKAAE